VKALPPRGDFDEFDLRHFRVGGIFVVPARLASMLIISGYAEMIEDTPRLAEAADRPHEVRSSSGLQACKR